MGVCDMENKLSPCPHTYIIGESYKLKSYKLTFSPYFLHFSSPPPRGLPSTGTFFSQSVETGMMFDVVQWAFQTIRFLAFVPETERFVPETERFVPDFARRSRVGDSIKYVKMLLRMSQMAPEMCL